MDGFDWMIPESGRSYERNLYSRFVDGLHKVDKRLLTIHFDWPSLINNNFIPIKTVHIQEYPHIHDRAFSTHRMVDSGVESGRF